MNLAGFPEVYVRMFKYARKMARSDDVAMEMASDAYASVFETVREMPLIEAAAYGCAAIRHQAIKDRAALRRDRHSVCIYDAETQYLLPSTPPAQENYVLFCEVAARIVRLSPRQRDCLKLAALDLRPREIARFLKTSLDDVVAGLKLGRKQIRAFADKKHVRKNNGFEGVRRHGRKFKADYRLNGKTVYVGIFASAEQAAAARAAAMGSTK